VEIPVDNVEAPLEVVVDNVPVDDVPVELVACVEPVEPVDPILVVCPVVDISWLCETIIWVYKLIALL